MSEAVKTKKTLFRKKEKKPTTPAREILSWVITLASAVAIALLIRTFLFIPVRVDGESMQNTLMNGEIVFAVKPAYLRGEYNRRDVVICHYPDRGNTLFVKRLVALPGDTVEIRQGALYVNGELVDESGIDMNTRSLDTMAPYTLGEDEYFVMGDNRGNSNDSRRVGPISSKMIVAHATRMIYPFSKFWDAIE